MAEPDKWARLYALYPPEKRTARHMLPLLNATERARAKVWGRAIGMKAGLSSFAKRDIFKEIKRLGERLAMYRAALLKAKPDDPIPREVLPLLFSVPGLRLVDSNGKEYPVPSPDAFTPDMIASMLGALSEHMKDMEHVFWRDLASEVKALPGKAAGVVRDVVDDVREQLGVPRVNWTAIAIGGVAIATVGAGVYFGSQARSQ